MSPASSSFNARDAARTSRRLPSLGLLSNYNRAFHFNTMAPLGHASTQAPQLRHAAASTLAATSPRVIASAGQTAWQAPQRVQACSSTCATGVVLRPDLDIGSPGACAVLPPVPAWRPRCTHRPCPRPRTRPIPRLRPRPEPPPPAGPVPSPLGTISSLSLGRPQAPQGAS